MDKYSGMDGLAHKNVGVLSVVCMSGQFDKTWEKGGVGISIGW